MKGLFLFMETLVSIDRYYGMNHITLTIICFLLYFPMQAQIEGVVFNSTTGEPQAYANISLMNTSKGCVSNSEGAFSLNISENNFLESKIRVSAVGVEPLELTLSSSFNDTIWVQDKIIVLAELKVYNDRPSATEMVRIALNKLPDMGYRKPYKLNAFYRHYCSEMDEYGRLIEAAIVLTDNKGHKKKVEKPIDKVGVEVVELRKSYDFTENFDEHEPISIYSTLQYDVMSYPSILSYYPDEYNFRVVDTSYMDNKMLWVIAYDYNRVDKVKMDTVREVCSGKIYINAEDFGVYLIKEHQEGTIEKTYETQSMVLDWRVQYQKLDDHYFLKYVSETSNSYEELRSTQQEIMSSKNHKAHVEMMVNDIQLHDVEKNSGGEPSKETLDEMEYDPEFWSNYNSLKSTPLNQKIVEDLTKRQSLDQQFEEN